jgi:hypothetical protein
MKDEGDSLSFLPLGFCKGPRTERKTRAFINKPPIPAAE